MIKSRYRRNKRKKQLTIRLVLIVSVIIAVILMMTSIYIASSNANTEIKYTNSVVHSVSINGDNINIEIFINNADSDIIYTILSIQGYNIPNGLSTQIIGHSQTKIIYEDFARGLTGTKVVTVVAGFENGDVKIISSNPLQFI